MTGERSNEERAVRATDIEAWRTAITHAKPAGLGEIEWSRVLGWVLDDLEAVRVERDALAEQVAALEASLREQDDRTPSALRSADYWLRQTQRVEAERDALAAELAELRRRYDDLSDQYSTFVEMGDL